MPPFSHLISCTLTKSNLYLANSLAAAESEPTLYSLLTSKEPNVMSLFRCLRRTSVSVRVRGSSKQFVTFYIFYDKKLLAPRPTPKL